MKTLTNDSNTAKYNKDVFLADKLAYTDILKVKSSKLPEYLTHLISSTEENVIVLEDGNLVYDSLSLPIENIYINERDIAKDEIPNQYINSLKLFDLDEANNQVADIKNKNNGGVAIYVTAGANIEQNIHIFNCSTINSNLVSNRIIIERDSAANLVIYNLNLSGAKYAMANTDILVSDYAKLNYTEVFNLTDDIKAYSSTRVCLLENASLALTSINSNSYTSLVDIDINLCGQYADAKVECLSIANNDSIQNTNIDIKHKAAYTNSHINNTALAKDNAQITYNNCSSIKKDMIKSNARQKTTGIMLSEGSMIAANPFLLIDCYDVSASHGASIGKFSDDDVFYLMSRGLTKDEAEATIVKGSIEPLYKELTSDVVRNNIKKTVKNKIGTISFDDEEEKYKGDEEIE